VLRPIGHVGKPRIASIFRAVQCFVSNGRFISGIVSNNPTFVARRTLNSFTINSGRPGLCVSLQREGEKGEIEAGLPPQGKRGVAGCPRSGGSGVTALYAVRSVGGDALLPA
jgi:hypothetical protein